MLFSILLTFVCAAAAPLKVERQDVPLNAVEPVAPDGGLPSMPQPQTDGSVSPEGQIPDVNGMGGVPTAPDGGASVPGSAAGGLDAGVPGSAAGSVDQGSWAQQGELGAPLAPGSGAGDLQQLANDAAANDMKVQQEAVNNLQQMIENAAADGVKAAQAAVDNAQQAVDNAAANAVKAAAENANQQIRSVEEA